MQYEITYVDNRTIFVFYERSKGFEEFVEIIEQVLQPDHKSDIEVTSWTQSFTFFKDGLEVYFEYFDFAGDQFYSFELFPFGNNNEDDIDRLRLMMDSLEII